MSIFSNLKERINVWVKNKIDAYGKNAVLFYVLDITRDSRNERMFIVKLSILTLVILIRSFKLIIRIFF